MKIFIVVLCCAVGLTAALPTLQQSSVLDLLKDLEDAVEDNGKGLITKLVRVIHHVEDSVVRVKEMVPKAYEKVHQEADEVLAGLKKVTDEVQEVLGRKNVYFGFDLLNGLTELSGGTKLGTALKLLSLADKAHRVMEDAKEFVPHLEDTLKKMQNHVEGHVTDFAQDVLKELGLQDVVAKSVMNKIQDLFDKVEEEGHLLILDLMHNIEHTFDLLEEKLPEEYERVQKAVEEIKKIMHELVVEIEKTLVLKSYSILDIAGDLSGGSKMSTVFKVMSLVEKFNTVVQDVKNFQPRAETFLQHSVKKVADSAQVFFSHAADKMLS